MLLKIILNFLIGLLIGFIAELVFRSFEHKKLIIPKFINYQMYGFTSAFLTIIYFWEIDLIFKLILIFIFPTLVEFLTGFLYKKVERISLWNYKKDKFNFMGIICLRFSFCWFIISLVYYYFILPQIISSI
ncbi:MAG: hypothetical protein WC822_05025 [Candidatus Paceibacterota bacterium]|jgi:uncharacterized membrane protein